MTALRKILLVEDNVDDAQLAIRSLRRGMVTNDIVLARNGEEALQELDTMNPLPCVVLLDLKLPKIDGLEVLRRIRASDRTRLLPVVILTSSSEDRDIVESYNLGANSYVRKPVEFTCFTDAIRQLGLYWVLINEPLPGGL
jgi:two-component system response regulator